MAEETVILDPVAVAEPEHQETVEQDSGTSAAAPAPRSIQDEINSLHGKAKEHYMKTGDVKAAKRLMSTKSDVAGSSPEDAVAPVAGNEAEPAPAHEQQGKREKPQSGADRNFESLRKAKERAETEARVLREQLAAVTASPKPAPKPEPKAETLNAEPVRPRMKDYTDPDAYDADLDKYEKNVKVWDRQEKARAESQQREAQTHQQAMDGYKRQVREAAKKYPDFQSVAFKEDLPLSHVAVFLIPRLENGADVQYWLGKNPAEAARIAKLTDLQGLDPNDPQGHLERLIKENHPIVHQTLGILRAEISRIPAGSTAPAASPKKHLREVNAASPRPSSEVDIEGSAAPVGDPIKAARAKGNWALANKLQNEKEIREKRGAR